MPDNSLSGGLTGPLGLDNVIPGLTGELGADAALQASRDQISASERAISQLREDLGPLRGTLDQSLPALMDFILNPQAQADYAMDNPLLSSLQEQSTLPILQNQAARGKLGSGDTLLALQNALVPMGAQMSRQHGADLFNLASIGGNAAARQGSQISEMILQQGNSAAAGGIGAANAYGQGASNIAGMGMSALSLLSDERAKENIIPVGRLHDDTAIYAYNYIGDEAVQIGVMAQEVEKKYPGVVSEVDGVKYVNYGELARHAN